ncbi:hypothetical protein GCM10022243_56770 [Saccharothrix violaceirubra]
MGGIGRRGLDRDEEEPACRDGRQCGRQCPVVTRCHGRFLSGFGSGETKDYGRRRHGVDSALTADVTAPHHEDDQE